MNNNNDGLEQLSRAAGAVGKTGKVAKKSVKGAASATKIVVKWFFALGSPILIGIVIFVIFLWMIVGAAGALVEGHEAETANTTSTVAGYKNAVDKACEAQGIAEYSNFVRAILWTYDDLCGENKTLDIMGAGNKTLNTKTKHEKGSIINMDYSIEVAVGEIAKLMKEYGMSSPEDISPNGELVLALIAQSYHYDTASNERGYYNSAKASGYTVAGAQAYLDSTLTSGIGIKTLDARFGERVIGHMKELDASDGGADSGANAPPPDGDCPTEWAGEYVYPLDTRFRHISSPYGNRWCPAHKKNEFHAGIDIAQKSPTIYNANIYAIADGTVIATGFEPNGYGNYVKIQHANFIAIYGHMEKKIAVPGEIKRGAIIGTVGSTGASTGNHLHFELRKYSGGTTDPTTIFKNFK